MTPRRAKLHFQKGPDEPAETVSLDFSEEEWQLLKDFVAAVSRVESCGIIQNGRTMNLRISYNQNSGLSVSADLPPEAEIREFLHVARWVILQEEPASFVNTAGLIGKRLAHPYVRSYVRSSRKLFDGTASQAYAVLTANGVVLNSDATLKVWLNAYEYHTDREKQKDLEKLHRIMPLESFRAIYIGLLLEKIRASQQLAILIELMLGSRDSIEVPTSFLT